LFLLGLVLAGATVVRGFRYATKIGWAFPAAVVELRAGKIDWTGMLKSLDPEGAKALYQGNVWLGGLSSGLFTVGTIGACAWLIMVSYCR
jgi:hypothetical protein